MKSHATFLKGLATATAISLLLTPAPAAAQLAVIDSANHAQNILQAARALLVDNGAMLVVDVAVLPEFTVPGPQRDRHEYGWSLVGCLPPAMGDPTSAMTGTVMRPATLARYATEAGFTEVHTLPIETDYWRFYRLVP